MKIFITSLFALLALAACDKEQKKIDTLAGTWHVSAASNNGTAVTATDYADVRYTFDNCKISKAIYCSGTYKVGNSSEAFFYRLADDDKKIEIDFESPALQDIQANFTQESDTKIHWVYTDVFNASIEITLDKN